MKRIESLGKLKSTRRDRKRLKWRMRRLFSRKIIRFRRLPRFQKKEILKDNS